MCGEGFNICCALNRYFDRSGILCEASGKHLGDLWEAIWSSGEIPELLYSLVKSSHVRSGTAKSAQGGSKKALRVAKLHPRCLAKMPCRELTNGHAESSRAGGGVPPKGKAIRRPQRSGGVNGVSGSEVTSAQVQVVEDLWSYFVFLCPHWAFDARS